MGQTSLFLPLGTRKGVHTVVATLPDGRSHTVDGFLTVDEKKMQDLPDAVVGDLHRTGVLGLMHLHWVSMGNMRRLVDWHVERGAAATGSVATST